MTFERERERERERVERERERERERGGGHTEGRRNRLSEEGIVTRDIRREREMRKHES